VSSKEPGVAEYHVSVDVRAVGARISQSMIDAGNIISTVAAGRKRNRKPCRDVMRSTSHVKPNEISLPIQGY
jgi:hypothetical protein